MDNSVQTIQLKHLNHQPLFRIGLFGGQEYIDFRVMGKFSLQDGEEIERHKKIKSDLKWRVKIKESKPGKDRFFLVLYESFDAKAAEAKLKLAQNIDPSATIKVVGGDTYLENRKINNNAKYIITAGDYPTEMTARKAFKRFQPDFIPYVEKECIKNPGGHLEVFDAEYDLSAEVTDVVRIVPDDVDTKIKIFGIRSYDDILQREQFTDLVFNGTIEFRFDNQGLLRAISEIPLESYLKRVIYSEIGADLPLEFSKSLAIVCRSEAMARLFHTCLGDPFDYTNFGETLRYYGVDFEDETIEKAVQLTSGQVIFSSDDFLFFS